MSNFTQGLKECIPPAYYPDGTEAKCMWYKVFNMFDLDPQSYIIDKEKNNMSKKREEYHYTLKVEDLSVNLQELHDSLEKEKRN